MEERNNRANVVTIGDLTFEAFGDRILVEEDEFISGYECEGCHGATKISCSNCLGQGSNHGKKCSLCDGTGAVTCPVCNGKGGLIVVPEMSQRRPTTGKIVSVGSECKRLNLGQSVMYSSYCGYTVDLQRAGKSVVLRILHEPEVLCLISGHLELRTIRSKSDLAMTTQ